MPTIERRIPEFKIYIYPVDANIKILSTYNFKVDNVPFSMSIVHREYPFNDNVAQFTYKDISFSVNIYNYCDNNPFIVMPNMVNLYNKYKYKNEFIRSNLDYILSFCNRPFDAINFVRQNAGHTVTTVKYDLLVTMNQLKIRDLMPIFYLNDNPALRNRTLEDFKNIKYKWALIKTYEEGNYVYLRDNYRNISGNNVVQTINNIFINEYELTAQANKPLAFFDTEEEAADTIDVLEQYIGELIKIYSITDISNRKEKIQRIKNKINHLYFYSPIQFLFLNKNQYFYFPFFGINSGREL